MEVNMAGRGLGCGTRLEEDLDVVHGWKRTLTGQETQLEEETRPEEKVKRKEGKIKTVRETWLERICQRMNVMA